MFAREIVDKSLHGVKDGEALEGAQESQDGAGVRVDANRKQQHGWLTPPKM